MDKKHAEIPFHTMRFIIKAGIRPFHVMRVICVYLLLAWASFFLVDVLNLFSIRDALISSNISVPIIWHILFREAGPTEILQWMALMFTAIISIGLSTMLVKETLKGHAAFWLILGIATLLMFVEDSLNPRHLITYYMKIVFSLLDSTKVHIASEFIFFLLLGAIPLYGILRYGRYPWQFFITRKYLILGFASYAIAVGASATRFVFDWYYFLGRYIQVNILQGALFIPNDFNEYLFFHEFIDFLFEESIELIGAGALLAAAISYLWEYEEGNINYNK